LRTKPNVQPKIRYNPIVRETGGLKDTITPYNDITHEGNGFTFSRYNAHDMLYAIKEAVHYYYHRSTWTYLMKKGMTTDFSWRSLQRNISNCMKNWLEIKYSERLIAKRD